MDRANSNAVRVKGLRPAAALAGAFAVLAFAACGGGGPAPAASPTLEVALPLERFHYVASLTLREDRPPGVARQIVVSTEGDFQSPDRHAFTYTTQFGAGVVSESAVLIGEDAWLRRGVEPWRQMTRAELEASGLLNSAFTTVRPNFLAGPEFDRVRENVRRLPPTAELINGVVAHHYQVGPPGKDYLQSFLAEQALLSGVRDVNWELWLAQDGVWPVRLLATASITADLPVLAQLGLLAPVSWELRIDISRPNDPTLSVLAPLG